jgi:flagellar basal body-associated protein FliL
MLGTLIIVLLIASIVALSAGFLMVALRLGKSFNQMGDQTSRAQQTRRRIGSRR